jgi:hypothetical protein
MRRSAVERAANLIIDHSGSGKPLGWLPAPHRKLCHFGANPGPHGAVQTGTPRNETFSRGQDPQQTSTVGGKRPRRRNFLRDLKVGVLKQGSVSVYVWFAQARDHDGHSDCNG